VLATNLDTQAFPCEVFCDLYHQRWRIEEAFKRLKAKLECVSGLTQHTLLVDVAAKVLADLGIAGVRSRQAGCTVATARTCL